MTNNLALFRWYFHEVDARLTLSGFIALIVGMVIFSDLGLVSVADGALYAVFLAILLPSLAPYLLVAVCTFQDVAGLSMLWWYGGTALLSLIIIVRAILKGGLRDQLPPPLYLLLVSALLVVSYAGATSLIHEYMHGHPQSEGRPPLLVAGLMIGMMVAGCLATVALFRDERAKQRLPWLVFILVANGLFVALARAIFGLATFATSAGLERVQEAAQLTEATSLGIPRLIGTYLTPNGFALCFALVMLLLLLQHEQVKDRFAVGYTIIGGVLAVLSLSKAMTIFFFLSAVILLWQSKYVKFIAMGGVVAMLLSGAYLFSNFDLAILLEAFRVPMGGEGDLGYRGQAWQLVTQRFEISDWIFGTGLAYWQVLFGQNLDFSLSDPHSYMLSIPGTFGILGVALYGMVALSLFGVIRRRAGGARALALILLVLFFVKDAVSIPYLIGNTPLTLLIWMLLAGVFISESQTGQARVT